MESIKEPLKFKYPASAFMLFLLLFAIGVELIIFAVLAPSGLISADATGSLWFLFIMQLLRFVLPLFIWLAITKDHFKRHMPRQPMGALNYVYVFFVSVLAIPAMMLVSGITSLFVNNDVADFLAGASDSGYTWVVMMLIVAVTPGIVEELIFRGYIQSISRGSIRKIALFNGLLFAIMHMNLHQFMYTFLLGIFFAYMVYYTRSIWSAIFSHFLVNGVNVSLMHWAMQSAQYTETAAEQTFSQLMYESFAAVDPALAQQLYDLFYDVDIMWIAIGMIAVIAIFATIAAVVLFYVLVQHNNKRNAAFDALKADTAPAAAEAPVEEARQTKGIDWCLAWVIVIYIAMAIVLPRVL